MSYTCVTTWLELDVLSLKCVWSKLCYTMFTLSWSFVKYFGVEFVVYMYVRTRHAKNAKRWERDPVHNVRHFLFNYFLVRPWLRILSTQAHFHAQSIKARLVLIGCKTAKLVAFFHWSTQRERTIDCCQTLVVAFNTLRKYFSTYKAT